MSGVTQPQRAAMVKLGNLPKFTGVVHQIIGDALVDAGYATRAGMTRLARKGRWKHHYTLTAAGVEYAQTGKLIGE
jgi:hypothetical protein